MSEALPTPLFDIVCAGAVNVDIIAVLDRVPLDDERVVSDTFITAGGGPAASAAVAAARLGARVAFCGVVGGDAEGVMARAMLEQEGVDTRWLRVDEHASTARALVLTSRSTSSRSIVTTLAPVPRCEDVPLGQSTWLHLDQTGYRGLNPTRQRGDTGVAVSLDGGNPIPGLVFRGIDLYVPTRTALHARFPGRSMAQAMAAALEEGAGQVIVTAGSDGAFVGEEGRVTHVPPFAIKPVSTLGAGDVFHGALLARLVAGDALLAAVRAANGAAALACGGIDGRSAIPTVEELHEFLHRAAL